MHHSLHHAIGIPQCQKHQPRPKHAVLAQPALQHHTLANVRGAQLAAQVRAGWQAGRGSRWRLGKQATGHIVHWSTSLQLQ